MSSRPCHRSIQAILNGKSRQRCCWIFTIHELHDTTILVPINYCRFSVFTKHSNILTVKVDILHVCASLNWNRIATIGGINPCLNCRKWCSGTAVSIWQPCRAVHIPYRADVAGIHTSIAFVSAHVRQCSSRIGPGAAV